MTLRIVPLIVCGGSGVRLWPASRSSRPKQFLPLLGALSTFQETVKRVDDPTLFTPPVIVTSDRHRFLVADQLQEIGAKAEIVLEPEARDSGPAILAGAMVAADRHGEDALTLSLAADHFVRDVSAFRADCALARDAAAAGAIVTFGIAPTGPSEAYGYIESGESIGGGAARKVARFVEKPDPATAADYIARGYLWNSGNFLFRADVLIGEYGEREPDTVRVVREAVSGKFEDLDFTRLTSAAFSAAAKRSVDYAVMEKTTRAAVVAASFDWSDVGSWDAVRALIQQDASGNAANGPAAFTDASRNMVWTDGALVSVVGLDDVSVIVTGDAVLVAKRTDSVGVKALVDALKTSHRQLTEEHLQAFRPWGNYRSLDMGSRHQVKRIVVKPGGRLSLQKHHHRSEHWVVVRGTADVTVSGEVTTLHENQSIYIPIGAVHRMENPGKIDLEIIEVQTGSYLGEDDIIRTEDIYNRAGS